MSYIRHACDITHAHLIRNARYRRYTMALRSCRAVAAERRSALSLPVEAVGGRGSEQWHGVELRQVRRS